MKHLRLSISASVLLAACSAAGGAAWSPIACGCIEPWQELGVELHLGNQLESPDSATKLVQAALDTQLVGREFTEDQFRYAGYPGICTRLNAGLAECQWWLWESGSEQRGVAARISINSSGVVQSVGVAEVRRQARVAPNNSSKPTPLRGAA